MTPGLSSPERRAGPDDIRTRLLLMRVGVPSNAENVSRVPDGLQRKLTGPPLGQDESGSQA